MDVVISWATGKQETLPDVMLAKAEVFPIFKRVRGQSRLFTDLGTNLRQQWFHEVKIFNLIPFTSYRVLYSFLCTLLSLNFAVVAPTTLITHKTVRYSKFEEKTKPHGHNLLIIKCVLNLILEKLNFANLNSSQILKLYATLKIVKIIKMENSTKKLR